MEELCRYIPRIDNDDNDDDDVYDTPAATESWDDECNDYASFLEHIQMWAAVMTELGMIRQLERVEMEMLHACNARGEPRQRPTKLRQTREVAATPELRLRSKNDENYVLI